MLALSAVEGFARGFLSASTPPPHALILKFPKPFVSPTYARPACNSFVSPTYAKTGGWGGGIYLFHGQTTPTTPFCDPLCSQRLCVSFSLPPPFSRGRTSTHPARRGKLVALGGHHDRYQFTSQSRDRRGACLY